MPPKIDYGKCHNCGKCVFQCGKSVFAFKCEKNQVFPSNAKECVDCFICYLVCPYDAVSVIRRKYNPAKFSVTYDHGQGGGMACGSQLGNK